MSSTVLEAQLRTPRRGNKATFFWRFRRNKLAVMGLGIVIVLVFIAAFANFIAPPHTTWPFCRSRVSFPVGLTGSALTR